jgi:hypothetical protein
MCVALSGANAEVRLSWCRRACHNPPMKRLGSVALFSVLGLFGCENPSRLDNTGTAKTGTPEAASAKLDRSGSVEERLARLEDNWAKHAEAFDFLAKVYGQQKQAQQQQERQEPAPDAVFAVDVAPNVKGGLVEGPSSALVTIVEAWDFA